MILKKNSKNAQSADIDILLSNDRQVANTLAALLGMHSKLYSSQTGPNEEVTTVLKLAVAKILKYKETCSSTCVEEQGDCC